MIDNVGQDEWFNLYLYLGSCWVNKSRYEARYSIRYRTQSPDLNRVLINWSSWNWERELDAKESRHESWAESSQFQNHLLKKDQFVDDLFNLHHLPDQPGPVKHLTEEPSCVCSLRRTDPDFFKVNSFKSENR
jgi:hypothetical protein